MTCLIIIISLSALISPFLTKHCSACIKIIPITIYFHSFIGYQTSVFIVIIFPAFFISPHIFIHNTCIKIKIIPDIAYFFSTFYRFSVHIVILIPVAVTLPVSFFKEKIQVHISVNSRHFS